MKLAPLIYLNLALAAVASLAYTQLDEADAPHTQAIHLVLITTFPEGSVAATDAQAAANAVKNDWKGAVTVLTSTADSVGLARTLKQALSLEPDGISMPGSRDEELLIPFITDAERQGIRITFHTDPMPEAERRFRHWGAGYVGDRDEAGGAALARFAVPTLKITAESHVLIVGSDVEPTPGYRLRGCLDYLTSVGNAPEYLQDAPVGNAGEPPFPRLAARMKETPQPDVIFWDAGPVDALIATLDAVAADPLRLGVATFVPVGPELADDELLYVKVQASERPFLTCYLSLVQLHLSEKHGVQGLQIPAGGL